jgi:hypothetical protein
MHMAPSARQYVPVAQTQECSFGPQVAPLASSFAASVLPASVPGHAAVGTMHIAPRCKQ